jgi:hypothetical protein
MANPATDEDREVEAYIKEQQQPISLLPDDALIITPTVLVVMDGTDFGFGSTDVQQASASLALRYGLSNRTEISAELPFGLTRMRSKLLDEETSETFTTGTASASIRHLIRQRSDVMPEVVIAAGFGMPVGNLPGAEAFGRVAIEAYHVIDPVVLSVSLGVVVGAETGDVNVDLDAGFDFAVNDRVSFALGAAWSGENGDFGDPLDAGVSFTGAITVSSPSGASALTPYFAIGATRAAPDVALGLTWSRRW